MGLRLAGDVDATIEVAGAEAITRRRWRRINRRWTILIGAGVALVLGAAAISATDVETDAGSNLVGLLASIATAALGLRWQFAAIVVALAAAHYLATAVAARASAGVDLEVGETLLVQLGAAAANRLTPAGLGGSALTARFFTRRGLTPSAAFGAVAALAVLGAVANFLVLLALVLLGRLFGLHGAASELGAVTAKVGHAFLSLRSPWPWIGVVLLIGLSLGMHLVRRRSSRESRGHFWAQIVGLIHRPRALLTLLLASGSTTLILAFAFVASTAMVPGSRPNVALGGLLVAFMLGSAASSSVPIPAGLGTTEATLVAVLVSAQVDAGHAVQVVLIFRLLTFWLPAVIGVLALRRLRRRGAI